MEKVEKQISLNDWVKEKILVGKQLYEAHKDVYDEWTTVFINKKIESLTPHLLSNSYSARFGRLTHDDLKWLSVYDWWVYGCRSDEFIYYNFWNKTATEKDEYIVYRDRMKIVSKLNKKSDAYLLNNKFETYKIVKSYYKRDLVKIETDKDYPAYLDFIKKHNRFVVKPLGGGGSVGVHLVDVNQWSDEKALFESLLKEGRECEVQKRLIGDSAAMLLEEVIIQDETMSSFHSASVNNVRIMSVRLGDEVRLFAPFFRVGAGGSFIASVATGGINAAVDADTGEIISDGYTSKLDVYQEHPDTGTRFKGFQLPHYEEAKQMIKEMAMKFNTLGYIGWDLAYSVKGWDVIEANYAANPVGGQICLQKGLKRDFQRIAPGVL